MHPARTFADVTVPVQHVQRRHPAATRVRQRLHLTTGRAPYSLADRRSDRARPAGDGRRPGDQPVPDLAAGRQYPEGYKVVRRGQVYQAKWYTKGQDPSTTVANPWDTPWTLVGPVRPGDKPFTPTHCLLVRTPNGTRCALREGRQGAARRPAVLGALAEPGRGAPDVAARSVPTRPGPHCSPSPASRRRPSTRRSASLAIRGC